MLLVAMALAATAVVQLFPSAQQRLHSKADEPTLIQEGVMSERQKKHSKLYKGLREAIGGRKLRDVVAEKGDVDIYEEAPDGQMPRVVDLNNYLRNIGCPADAVVMGTVQARHRS